MAAKRPTAPGSARQPPAKRRSRVAPAVRLRALDLLAEGELMSTVADVVGVDVTTVRAWAASEEGQHRLAAAERVREAIRAAEEKGRVEGATAAKRVLVESTVLAAKVLKDALTHKRPYVRIRAAVQILDRAGVPRTEKIETGEGDEWDLSRFTDDELADFERLRAKAARKGATGE